MFKVTLGISSPLADPFDKILVRVLMVGRNLLVAADCALPKHTSQWNASRVIVGTLAQVAHKACTEFNLTGEESMKLNENMLNFIATDLPLALKRYGE